MGEGNKGDTFPELCISAEGRLGSFSPHSASLRLSCHIGQLMLEASLEDALISDYFAGGGGNNGFFSYLLHDIQGSQRLPMGLQKVQGQHIKGIKSFDYHPKLAEVF